MAIPPSPLALQDLAAASLWLNVLSVFALGGIALLAWQILRRLRDPSGLRGIDARLGELQSELARLGESRAALDLRRLEHLLIELRDAHKRLEERMMQIVESARAAQSDERQGKGPVPASERVVNRLLAMGYERIQIVTPPAELTHIFEQGGEVLVEARQGGAICKGRLRVREGAIVDADLRSAHAMFP